MRIDSMVVAAVFVASVASPLAAQTTSSASTSASTTATTQADVLRLQDNVYLADRDVTQLRSRDAARATSLQSELDELRDEVVYLRVKLRKERALPRAEYIDVRDRIESVRSRARGEGQYTFGQPAPATSRPAATSGATTGSTTAPRPAARAASEIPTGTEIDLRLTNSLNSGTAQVEDRFEATSLADLTLDGRVYVPAGAVFRGVVSSVEPGTRTNRTSRLTVTFDQMTVGGRAYPIRGTVTQALEGEGVRGEAGRAGVGAGVGAIIGGLLGGFKGAVAGVLIGGGGTIAATEGKEVELPQGTVLKMRFDSPVAIQPR